MHEHAPSVTANDQPLVSGIMIFLNAATYMEEAIESVFAQTYENWELLLVDDGSTDASTEIARRYVKAHPGKLRYLEHPGHENRGMSAARNLGIKNARGTYIALLDADDVWLPHKLKEQIAILNSQPEAMMMYGRTRFWWSWTGQPEHMQGDWLTPLRLEPDRVIQPPHLLTHHILNKESVPCTCGLLIRRELFDRVGFFEEGFRSQSEDLVFHAKASLHYPIYVASGCWDQYRQHVGNSVHQAQASGEFSCHKPNPVRGRYLEWVFHYVASQNVHNKELDRALRRELWPYRHPSAQKNIQRIRDSWMGLREKLKQLFRRTMPARLEYAFGRRLRGNSYPIPKHLIDFGNLRRLWPVSDASPDRGLPVSNYYIDHFLSCRDTDVKGCVVEFPTDRYTHMLGAGRVTRGTVGNLLEGSSTDTLPSESFDCAIVVQELACVADALAALRAVHRILKPGGVLLAALPASPQAGDPARAASFFRSFTRLSAERLFEEVFPKENIRIECFGNALSSIALLHGLAADELKREELEHRDPRYEVIIGVRAMKPCIQGPALDGK